MNEENGRSSKFLLFLYNFFCLACNIVPENWHICVNKGITYLLSYCLLIERGGYEKKEKNVSACVGHE